MHLVNEMGRIKKLSVLYKLANPADEHCLSSPSQAAIRRPLVRERVSCTALLPEIKQSTEVRSLVAIQESYHMLITEVISEKD